MTTTDNRQVSQEEFYAAMGPLNVHPRIEVRSVVTPIFPDGRTLYDSVFETPGRLERGRIIENLADDSALPTHTYYLR